MSGGDRFHCAARLAACDLQHGPRNADEPRSTGAVGSGIAAAVPTMSEVLADLAHLRLIPEDLVDDDHAGVNARPLRRRYDGSHRAVGRNSESNFLDQAGRKYSKSGGSLMCC